jgi:hypothetical protein
MKQQVLKRSEIEANPHCVWNAYIDLLSSGSLEECTDVQRPPRMVFVYESEVQNGGHLQYFENQRTVHLKKTIESLGIIGAPCQQEVLREAGNLFVSIERPKITTAEEYVEAAREDEFSELDFRFHCCSPSLMEILEAYLQKHLSSFILVE